MSVEEPRLESKSLMQAASFSLSERCRVIAEKTQ